MSISLLGVLEQANAPEYIDFHNISFNDGADKFFDINPETTDENNKNLINKTKTPVPFSEVPEADKGKNNDKNCEKELSAAVKNLNIEIKTATEKLKDRKTETLQQKNHVSKYIPVAEQVLRYQKSTPKRFRVQPRGGKSGSKNISTPAQQHTQKLAPNSQITKSSSRVKHIVQTVQYKDGMVTLADYEVTNFGVPRSKKQNLTTFSNVPTGLFERHEQAKAKKEEMMKRLQIEQPVKLFKAKPAPKFAPPPVRVNAAIKLATAAKKIGSTESLPSKTIKSKNISKVFSMPSIPVKLSIISHNLKTTNKTQSTNLSKNASTQALNQNKNQPRYKGAPVLSTTERHRFHTANEQGRLDRARQVQEKKERLRLEREQKEIEKARREASSFKAKPAPKFKKPFTIRPVDKELTEPKGPNFMNK